MLKKGITIFTPTYNRGYILSKAYNSLLQQTRKNFEWLIVDDGSTDNTKEMVQTWIKENKVDIKYFYQKNAGKPLAHNVGVKNANYELFLCLDSDDYLTESAVEDILIKYENVKNYDSLTGILAFRKIINRDNVQIPKVEFATIEDLYYKYKYTYDLALAFKTEILKKYPFPKIPNEKFIQENYIYDQINTIGKMAVLPKQIYVCEYLEDGYSKNIRNIIKKNPNSYVLCAKQKLIKSKYLKAKAHAAVRYTIGSFLINNHHYIKEVDGIKNKLMLLLAFPVGWLSYVRRYKQ